MGFKFNPFTGNLDLVTSSSGSTLSSTGLVISNASFSGSAALGDWVRATAGGVFLPALADSVSNSNVVGVIETIANASTSNATGTVRVLGVTSAIFSSLDVNQEYFLSDVNPGKITTTIPTAAGHTVTRVGQPVSATQFLVLKGTRIIRS